MSLELRLTSFRGGGTRGDRIVKATFRGQNIFPAKILTVLGHLGRGRFHQHILAKLLCL